MKKFIYILFISLLLVGCNSSKDEEKSDVARKDEGKSVITMDSFIKAFEDKGIEVDPNEKPLFSLIGARDGIIFYNENNPVKIYEFDSEEAIQTAEESMPAMKDWERNGLFVLETNDEESKGIFKAVK